MGFLIRSSCTFHWCPHLHYFEKWEKQLCKGLPSFDCRKFGKRKFLCLNIQSLEVLSKKISWLSMISKIGKLRVRKKFHYTIRAVYMFKDYDVHCVQTLQKRFKTWTAFPEMSGLQSESRKWLIRQVVTTRLVRYNDNCKPGLGCWKGG